MIGRCCVVPRHTALDQPAQACGGDGERGARASGKALGLSVVVEWHAGRRTWPTAARNLLRGSLRHRGKRKGAHGGRVGRTATQGWVVPARPLPTRCTPDPRARERRCVPGRGEEGGCGRQSGMSMSGERQAVCARRVDVQRPKGVGWVVAEPHEVGTDTRNDNSKIDC